MITPNEALTLERLASKFPLFWKLSGEKLSLIAEEFDHEKGAPVFTVAGEYTTRGWTEWTQGFQFGASLLQFDATNNEEFLEYGRVNTVEHMASHVTHFGVHDHGFNTVSTYGNLLRLMNEGRIDDNEWERTFYEMALKSSGAVQAHRWTQLNPKEGFVYSFNGPHSLFADTIRSMRSLAVAHQLGHVLSGEHDARTSLLERLIMHARATANYNVYYGEGRDGYDLWGRVAHESIFNLNDGYYRCPSTQQGYTPFSTWTRGLAWIMLGFAEELEFLTTLSEKEFEPYGGRERIEQLFLKAAQASCDFYIENTPTCGVPYWDTGAPTLHQLGDYLNRPAEPFNQFEPVDSSAAAIASQGLLRLGNYLNTEREGTGDKYWTAGLTVIDTLLSEPYLSTNSQHHGLLLHAVYHWPNRWDYVPEGQSVACGEATMWGDYHLREAVLYLQRIYENKPYHTFYLK